MRVPLVLRLAVLVAAAIDLRLSAAGMEALPPPDAEGRIQVVLAPGMHTGRVEYAWKGQFLASAFLEGSPKRYVKWWNMARNGHSIDLSLVQLGTFPEPARLTLEVAEQVTQFADGRWVFPVVQAIHEPHHFHEPRRFVWNFEATRPGTYFVEVAGQGWSVEGEAVELFIADRKRSVLMRNLDSHRRWSISHAGRMRIASAGPQTLVAVLGERGHYLNGDIAAVIFRPAPEGDRIYHPAVASRTLPTTEASLHGRTLRSGNAGIEGWDESGRSSVAWWLDVAGGGDYRVDVAGQISAGQAVGTSKLMVRVAGHRVTTIASGPTPDGTGLVRWTALAIDVPSGEVELEIQPSPDLVGAGFRLQDVHWTQP